MLVVADLHLGKPAAFRAAGVPVPEVIDADLTDLTRLIQRLRPSTLVFAGDLLHARSGRTAAVFEPFVRWRRQHTEIEIILVRGNHDRRSGDPPASAGIRVVEEPFRLTQGDSVGFAHDPDLPRKPRLPVLCGHLHPSAVLSDGCSGLRAPCFWARPRELILPAFGRFTGTRTIRARAGDRVFVVGDDQVVEALGVVVTRPAEQASAAAKPSH